jgi:SP family xylose:H+ symportor-like MFS transporter
MQKKTNSMFLLGITLVAAIGGLLFGYDTAVISGAAESIKSYLIDSLHLGSFIYGATISSALIGCVIGGIISGQFASKFGRKNSLIISSILFLIASLGAAYPEFLFFTKGQPTIGLLIAFNIYRIIGGIGVGLASAVCPMYIGEVAPANVRGRLVSFNQFMIILGMLVAYFVNYSIAHGQSQQWINDIGWRYMFAYCGVPALMFGVFLLFVPETPRYLSLTNQSDKALAILTKINGAKAAKSILQEIQQTVDVSTEKLFTYGKGVIIIGILLSVFQQFVGINVALYYAPRIFESMGAGQNASMMQTTIMGLVNVIFTVVAIMTVDKWGRRPLLMVGSIGMALGMIGVATMAYIGAIGIGTLIFIIIYTASFMMSWGPICWVLISEIFPNKIRGRAVAIAVAAQWAANYLISSTYPVMMQHSGAMTYGFYGLMSILSAIFVWKFVPETKGMTLEEMDNTWSKSA